MICSSSFKINGSKTVKEFEFLRPKGSHIDGEFRFKVSITFLVHDLPELIITPIKGPAGAGEATHTCITTTVIHIRHVMKILYVVPSNALLCSTVYRYIIVHPGVCAVSTHGFRSDEGSKVNWTSPAPLNTEYRISIGYNKEWNQLNLLRLWLEDKGKIGATLIYKYYTSFSKP